MICILVDDYLPHSTKVAAKMMHDLACEFLARGHQVTVITPGGPMSLRGKSDILDGIRIMRFRSGNPKATSKIRRAITESLLPWRAWSQLKGFFKANRHDLIVYFSPTIFWGPLVTRLRALWGAKAYLVLRDFFPQWAVDSGLLREWSPITSYFRYFERLNYRSADRIGIQPKSNLVVFNNQQKRFFSTELLYNWASETKRSGKSGNYRNKLGLKNKVVFFYGGNIGHAQDIANILRLAQNMRQYPAAHFVFAGSGDQVSILTEALRTKSIVNATYLPAMPQDDFFRLQSEFDVGVFSLSKHHTTHNIPGKILGYLAQGKPILGCVNPNNDLVEIINNSGAGFVSISGEDKELLENATKLLRASIRNNSGKRARKLLHDVFSVRSAAAQILRLSQYSNPPIKS